MKPFIFLQKQHQRDSDQDSLADLVACVYPDSFSPPRVFHLSTASLPNLRTQVWMSRVRAEGRAANARWIIPTQRLCSRMCRSPPPLTV